MRIQLTLFILALFALPWIFSCNGFTSDGQSSDKDIATTTFVLVRHAEKSTGEDPELTAAGVARAAKLSKKLAGANVAAVYSTNTKRTMATATPTAKAKQLTVQTYDAGNPRGFAAELKKKHKGQTILIVGHSTSTPDLANALSGGGSFRAISEDDYGNIYTVKISSNGKASSATSRY